eukprot:scaffold10771_cov121-Skeletonema_dohrnii-CCMP3373.AAC.2
MGKKHFCHGTNEGGGAHYSSPLRYQSIALVSRRPSICIDLNEMKSVKWAFKLVAWMDQTL